MPKDHPSSPQITRALRNSITALLKSDDPSELTLRRVRADAEEALGLEKDFFKRNVAGGWKDRSKTFVTDEVTRQEELLTNGGSLEEEKVDEDDASPAKPAKRARKAAPEPSEHSDSTKEDESESDMSELDDESPPPRKKKRTSEPDLSKEDSSELSDVIDEAPKRKSAKKAKPKTNSKADKPKSSYATATAALSDDDAEIKRLQGWLIKCGIRKLWHRELEPYPTPEAKIAHLKSMLQDAGMSGRFSVDKARQIREERELKQELEAVSEGNKAWGNPNDGEGGSRRRQVPKGLQELDFLVDEESD